LFYDAIASFDMGNSDTIDSIDFSKWLKKHLKYICDPYNEESRQILAQRDEAEKPIKKMIKKHGGDDVLDA